MSENQTNKPHKLFTQSCDFVLGVAGLEQLPEADRSEVAFAGRSNVGKSSLLNALTSRKALARTSHTPGRTQQLNFFDLAGQIYLVDMPGYGYAKVSKTQRDDWNDLMKRYLRGRPNLRCCFILIDARHGLKDSDEEMMDMLDEAAVSYRIILTKTDKVKDQELEKINKKILEKLKKHGAAHPELLPTSAHKNHGVYDLQEVIASYI